MQKKKRVSHSASASIEHFLTWMTVCTRSYQLAKYCIDSDVKSDRM